MTRALAFAALALAAFGFSASRGPHDPDGVPDNPKPTVAAPETDKTPAIQTPLVATLLPGGTAEPSATDAPPDHFVEPNKLVDGQLSPRGEWRWSEAQWAWVPVKKPGPAWVQDGHSATIDHLVREHGYSRASLEKLTPSQLDTLHSNAHNAARGVTRSPNVSQKTDFRNTSCPSGNCPSPARSRGLFRWR